MYIVRFLHQTTTEIDHAAFAEKLYIVRFLHQTTTHDDLQSLEQCCISSVSYIKPQLEEDKINAKYVVYRPFPTSNHNLVGLVVRAIELYIVRFLHQTTTGKWKKKGVVGCISSVSYIKPQLRRWRCLRGWVVYRPFPTSNHNNTGSCSAPFSVVYRPFPTSNHNYTRKSIKKYMLYIVRFLHQTTTYKQPSSKYVQLYIVRFLHQTTT